MAPLRTLQGIRIAAFTQFLLGPAAVQHLAELGADVIKVESPGSGAWERHWAGAQTYPGGVSAFFMLANRNLRSVTLDLKSEAGKAAALKLIASSDVVVENFRPGVMERLGLGFEAASAVRPGLIYASASGYGTDSPFRDLPGQDLLIQGLSGVAWLNSRGSGGPEAAGAAVVDQHGAALFAMGILAALLHRERTGEGQRLEVAMLTAALDLYTEPVVYSLNGAKLEPPVSPVADTFHEAPYGIYPTADGHVVVSMTTVTALKAALGDAPELDGLEDPGLAYTERNRIGNALAAVLARHTSESVVALLRAKNLWCSPVNNLEQALADPALLHLDPILEMEHPIAGKVRVLRHPVRYGAGEPELRHTPPESGQHSAEVLSELGYSAAEISAMVPGAG